MFLLIFIFLFELHQHVTGTLYCRWTIFSSRRMAFNDIVNLSLEEGSRYEDSKNDLLFAKAVCKCNMFLHADDAALLISD